jgi:hypothetical protein
MNTAKGNNERRLTIKDELTEFLLYTAPDGQVKVECILHDETIWLTQDRIAELFGVQRPAITKHLKNIFDSGELKEKLVSSILEHTTQHGAIERKTPQLSCISCLSWLKNIRVHLCSFVVPNGGAQ